MSCQISANHGKQSNELKGHLFVWSNEGDLGYRKLRVLITISCQTIIFDRSFLQQQSRLRENKTEYTFLCIAEVCQTSRAGSKSAKNGFTSRNENCNYQNYHYIDDAYRGRIIMKHAMWHHLRERKIFQSKIFRKQLNTRDLSWQSWF